tara:strand:- start:2068 stop:2292 length:225 start_codon:yes stop_codon:yes gene_type:complete
MKQVFIYKTQEIVTLVSQNPEARSFIANKVDKKQWAYKDPNDIHNSPIIVNPDFYIPIIGILKTNNFDVAVNGK